jgi:autotransporter-associated beta strand protein
LLASSALIAAPAAALDATWLAVPPTADWNTPTNWSPATVPTGTASFGLSNTTGLTFSAASNTIGTMQFNAGAPAYTFNMPATQLTINGTGIVNNSSNKPTFLVDGSNLVTQSMLNFGNGATAGNANITVSNSAFLQFFDTSSAGSATIDASNVGQLIFYDSSTAGSATITGNFDFRNSSSAGSAQLNIPAGVGLATFEDSSTAANANITIASGAIGIWFTNSTSGGNAVIDNAGAGIPLLGGAGSLVFTSSSTPTDPTVRTPTAANAAITNHDGGELQFGLFTGTYIPFFNIDFSKGTGSAGNATIINNNGGTTSFFNQSDAGTATITNNSGGLLRFINAGGLPADPDASNARVINNAGGQVDISGVNIGVSIGSIEGAGDVSLGSKVLTLGNTNLNTEISGTINDGGTSGGVGGSLVKVGTGTLLLSGTNGYSGGTTISGGIVQVTNANSVGSGAVTLDGGTFQVFGLNTISFSNDFKINTAGGTVDNNGNPLELAGIISNGNGATGVLQLTDSTGGGVTLLSGVNTYGGGTKVIGTTVQVNNDSSVGTGLVTLEDALFMAADNVPAGSLTFANNFAINNTPFGSAIDVNGYTMTISGNIADGNGPGQLTVQDSSFGSGVLIFTGDKTYTGGTTICFCGTLQLGTTAAAGSIRGPVTNEGVLDVVNSDTSLITTLTNDGGEANFFNGTNASAITIVNKNSGTTIFHDNSSALNANITNRIGGAVVFLDNASAGNATIVNNFGGFTEFGQSFGSDTPHAGTATITNNNGGTTDFNAASSADHATIITNNGGALDFWDTSTADHASITTNSGGKTFFNDKSDGGFAQFITNGSGSVDFSFSIGPNSDGRINAGSIEGSGTYYIGTADTTVVPKNTLVVGSNNLSTAVSGVIADTDPCGCAPNPGPGTLEKVGTGTLTLSGSNTYSGGTTLIGGTVSVSQEANLGDPSGGLTFNGGILQITGTSFTFTPRTIAWGAGGGGFDIADAANSFTAGPLVGAGGALTKLGAGTLVLTGANTYTGGTTVAGGTLSIGADNNIGTGSLAMLNGTTLTFTGSFLFSHSVTVAGDPTFNVPTGNTVNMAGVISDGGTPGDVVKTGGGKLILTAANTYTGGTTISAGTLALGSGGSILGSVTNSANFEIDSGATYNLSGTLSSTNLLNSLTTLAGGTLHATSNSPVSDNVKFADNTTSTIGAASGQTLTVGVNGSTTSAGNNSAIKIGSATDTGVVVFASSGGSSLGTQTVEVVGGTWRSGSLLGINGLTQFGVSTTVDAGATIDLNSFNATINTLLGAGTVTIGNNASAQLLLTGSSNFGGAIMGAGQLLTGSGTQILTGTNTYAGGTTIQSGSTLQLGSGGTTGSIVGDITDNGTLALNRSNALTLGGAISGSGAMQQNGSGTTILTGTNTYTGGTTITAGTLQLGNGGASGSVVGNIVDNGVLAINRSDNFILANTISGTGSLLQNGSGITRLTGTNTYTGGTTISAGTLQLGAGGAGATTGSIVGNVVDNGILALAHSDAMTFGGVISGTGQVMQIGSGTTTLTGANTYSGGTFLNNGILAVSANTNLGAASGGLTFNGGTLRALADFNSNRLVTLNAAGGTIGTNGFNVNLGGVISGVGGLTKNGNGVLGLTADNTYTGGTTISAGALRLGSGGTSGSILGDVVDNAAFTINRSDTYTFAGLISGAGVFNQIGTGTTVFTNDNTYTGGTTISAGTLQLGNGGTTGSFVGDVANNGTLAFNRSNALTFGGVISGTGAVAQNGSGSTNLTATNTYTGATSVNAGTLFVNGSIASSSALTVNAGGTVGGSGALPKTTINGGTLSPGNSIGTISISGSLTFVGAGNYIVEVSPSASDKTNVSGAPGTAALAGALSAVGTGGTYTVGTRYTVLNATGGVSGTFGSLAISGSFGATKPHVEYDANNVYLVLDPNALPLTGLTPNERSVAAAINTALLAGNQSAPFVALFGLTAAQLPGALDQLSGEVHPSTASVLLDESLYARSAVLGRLRQASYGGDAGMASLSAGGPTAFANGEELSALAYAKSPIVTKAPPLVSQPSYDVVFWAQGFGAWGRFDTDGNAASVRRDLAGFFTGVDTKVGSNGRLGIAAGYTGSKNTLDNRGGSTVETGHIAGYGGWSFGGLNLRGGGDYAFHTIDTSRTVFFPGFFDTDTAHYNGSTAQIFGEAGYGFAFGKVAVEPFAGAAFVRLQTDAFNERGGAAALTVAANSFEVGYSTLGIRAATMIPVAADMMLVPRASAAWQHAFDTVTPADTMAFQSAGVAFVIAGAPIARDSALAEAGLDLAIGRNATIGISYVGQIANNVQDHAAKGRFSWKF